MTVPPLRYVDVIAHHARHRPGELALVDDGTSWTYSELWLASCHAARQVADACGGDGERVALIGDPTVRYVAWLFGCMLTGAIAAPVNSRLSGVEIGQYLERIAPSLVVTDDEEWRGRVAASLPLDGIDPARGRADAETFGGLVDGRLGDADEAGGAIAFPTGGTTGLPKAAVWTHRGLRLAAQSSCEHLRITPFDRELYISPPFHVTLVVGVLATLHAGGCCRLQRRFDAADAARRLLAGEVTRMFGTPTAYERILDAAGAGPHHAVAANLVYGAARSDERFRRRLADTFPGASLFSGYGATEFGAVVRLYPEDAASHGVGAGVGRPVAGVRVRAVDPDGTDAAAGEVGELAIWSPWRMAGYLGGSDGDAVEELADGSLMSGDFGRVDEHGFVHLSGRRKEAIKTGGELVFAAEVERALLAHDDVADAAAYGVIDDEWGERIQALVVWRPASTPPTEDELRSFCRQRLAGFKVPKRIDPVESLPYTPNLKLDRAALLRVAATIGGGSESGSREGDTSC